VNQVLACFHAWCPRRIIGKSGQKHRITTRNYANPEMPSMEVYESVMQTTLEKNKKSGVTLYFLEI
jgi:hypothetical protein